MTKETKRSIRELTFDDPEEGSDVTVAEALARFIELQKSRYQVIADNAAEQEQSTGIPSEDSADKTSDAA